MRPHLCVKGPRRGIATTSSGMGLERMRLIFVSMARRAIGMKGGFRLSRCLSFRRQSRASRTPPSEWRSSRRCSKARRWGVGSPRRHDGIRRRVPPIVVIATPLFALISVIPLKWFDSVIGGIDIDMRFDYWSNSPSCFGIEGRPRSLSAVPMILALSTSLSSSAR